MVKFFCNSDDKCGIYMKDEIHKMNGLELAIYIYNAADNRIIKYIYSLGLRIRNRVIYKKIQMVFGSLNKSTKVKLTKILYLFHIIKAYKYKCTFVCAFVYN
jgi:hypothetical protein